MGLELGTIEASVRTLGVALGANDGVLVGIVDTMLLGDG